MCLNPPAAKNFSATLAVGPTVDPALGAAGPDPEHGAFDIGLYTGSDRDGDRCVGS
jgi:hypothetical protein